jgi:hypothetical protein
LHRLESSKDAHALLIAETNDPYRVGAQFIAPYDAPPNLPYHEAYALDITPQHHYEWQSEEARNIAYTLEQSNGNGHTTNLNTIDLCAITPLDALNLLFLLQRKRNTIST